MATVKKKEDIFAPTPYNPLDKRNLGESVAGAMLKSEIHPLPPEKFKGAGIYAIYYTGDFEAYKDLSAVNREGKFSRPIYVGKAVPAGARKGGIGLGADPGTALFKRLCEHYYIVTMADECISSADTTLACFRGYAECVEGAVEKGVIIGSGVCEAGTVRNTPAMAQAYEMGRKV